MKQGYILGYIPSVLATARPVPQPVNLVFYILYEVKSEKVEIHSSQWKNVHVWCRFESASPTYNALLPFGSMHSTWRTDHAVWLIFTNVQAKQTASIFRLRLKIGHTVL